MRTRAGPKEGEQKVEIRKLLLFVKTLGELLASLSSPGLKRFI